MPDNLAAWLNLILVAGGLGVWTWLILGFDEWTDFHGDIDRARQERMGRIQLRWVKFVAWLGSFTWPIWGTGAVVIIWFGFAHPEIGSLAVAVVGGTYALRAPDDQPDQPPEIQQLRTALGDINKDPDNPPAVTPEGEHPEGGPLRLYIAGHPNFKEYQKAHRDAVENAIEYRLTGDWENVDWFGDGSSVWERIVLPPARVAYTQHFDELPPDDAGKRKPWPWYQIPVGVDGHGNVGIMDLRDNPHWTIAGNTTNGKTSVLRPMAAHLLHHGVEVAAIDVKGGLSFLRGREGVRLVATRRVDTMTAGMLAIRDEVAKRADLFDRDGSYLNPLVVFCDEVATACQWAGKNSDFTNALLESIRLAAQGQVFFLLSTQRPSADAIPIEVRGQAEGRIAVGPMEPEVAQMMFERQWARAVDTKNTKGRLVLGDMSGQDNAWFQAFWMADPRDTNHPLAERELAEALLPPVVQIADGDVTSDESDDTHQEESKPKRELPARSHGDGTPVVVGTGAVTTERGLLALVEKALEDRAANAKRTARWREGFQKKLLDPNAKEHGTRTAIREGCPLECDKCTPRPVEVSS